MNSELNKYLQIYPKKYLIFDFDETIAKMDIDWIQWRCELIPVFHSFDPNFNYDSNSDRKLNDYYNDFSKKYESAFREKYFGVNEKFELENTKQYLPNTDLVGFIKGDKNYIKFIYSNNSLKAIEKGLIDLEIENKFTQIFSREKVEFIKPEIDGLSKIVAKNDKKDYLMIGDSSSDRKAAESFGIDFFHVEYF